MNELTEEKIKRIQEQLAACNAEYAGYREQMIRNVKAMDEQLAALKSKLGEAEKILKTIKEEAGYCGVPLATLRSIIDVSEKFLSSLRTPSDGEGEANTVYFEVGMKKGEWDFGVSGAVYDLSYEEMKVLREMIIVGIGSLEQMWRDAQARKNPCYQATKPDGQEKGS